MHTENLMYIYTQHIHARQRIWVPHGVLVCKWLWMRGVGLAIRGFGGLNRFMRGIGSHRRFTRGVGGQCMAYLSLITGLWPQKVVWVWWLRDILLVINDRRATLPFKIFYIEGVSSQKLFNLLTVIPLSFSPSSHLSEPSHVCPFGK